MSGIIPVKNKMRFLLYRAADAQPLAILEANYLGQIRTGAASGLATKFMAPADASMLAIIPPPAKRSAR